MISDTVEVTDLEVFYARYEGEGRRRQPFDPRTTAKVLVSSHASGVFLSREIAARLQQDGKRHLKAVSTTAH